MHENGQRRRPPDSRFALAWVLLSLALALHVLDEAVTDFLAVYNPAALAIRQRVPWLPVPVFTFRVWLTGLVVAVACLLSLTYFARPPRTWLIVAAFPIAVLMLANAVGHIAGSIALGRLMPGVVSSPVLLAAAGYLLVCAWRAWRQRHRG